MKLTKNRFILAAASTLLFTPFALAGNTWDGGGTAVSGLYNWSDDANWDAITGPAYGTLLTFAGSTGLTSNNNGATSSIAGITFSSGAGAFTLSGSSVTLGGNITNSSTSLQTINLPLVLDAQRTITTANGNISLGGQISGAYTLVKGGVFTLTMNTAGSSFSRLQINSGIVKLGVNDALPTTAGLTTATGADGGTLDLNGKTQTLGGTITIAGNVAGTVTINDTAGGGLLKLGNNVSQNAASLSNVTISAALDLNGATRTFTLDTAATTFNVSGAISNSTGTAGLTKAGVGTLTLSQANTYNGDTKVSAGLLTLSNALALQNSTLDTTNSIASSNATTGLKTTVTTLTLGGLSGGTNLASLFDATNGYGGVTALTLNPASGQTPSYSGVIADGATGMTLTKTGDGTQILAGSNTFTGATKVTAGTLQLNNALALQNSAIDTANSITGTTNAGIALNGVTSPTFGGLTGNKNLASLFDTDTGNYGLVTNVTLNPGTGADHTYSGEIADGATGMTLTKTGAGRQVLSVANAYTGRTILNGGTLNYSNASALSTGPISYTGGTILQAGVATTLANDISVNADIVGTVGTAGFATTLSGAITGAGTLAKGGGGLLTLTGGLDNTIAGGFRVVSGRLDVLDGLSLTNTGPVTVLSGGSLNYSKGFNPVGNDLTNNLTLSGTGVDGFGALNLRGNAAAIGAITLAADATISHDFNSATISGSITGTNRNLTLRTLTTTVAQPGMTVSAPISLGTGALTVTGVANTGGFSIRLTGNNSYSGGTTVTAGTLQVNNTTGSGTGSGTVTVNSGAILGGTGTIAGNIAATGSIAPGTTGIGTLKVGGDVTWNSGNAWKFDLSSINNTSDKLEITGALTKGSGSSFVFDFMGSTPFWGETFTLATFGSSTFSLGNFDLAGSIATLGAGSYGASSFMLNSTSLQFVAIPEPTSALAGLLLTAGLLRRRRR